MSKYVFTALALAAAGSSASATTGNDWLELDREINALTRSSALQGSGINMAALLRANLSYSGDDLYTGGGADIFGFEADDVDLSFWGEVGEFGYRISADLDGKGAAQDVGGTLVTKSLQLQDAYGFWQLSDFVRATLGVYKPKVFASNDVAPENQVMIDRTVLGSAFDMWNLGAGVNGTYDMIDWAFHVQNGADGEANDSRYVLRVEYDLGNGAGDYEGSYGGGDDLHATAGVVYVNDDSEGSEVGLFGVDFMGTYDAFGFGVELASVEDGNAGFAGFPAAGDLGFGNASGFGGIVADSTPWSLTGAYRLNEEFEVAARIQQIDDTNDTSIITIGLNWFQNGHNAKWQANITDVSSDASALEGTGVQVGLVLGSSQ